jgi:hypothetical protein
MQIFQPFIELRPARRAKREMSIYGGADFFEGGTACQETGVISKQDEAFLTREDHGPARIMGEQEQLP